MQGITKQDIAKYVGKQIKKFRLMRGMTQKELGIKIGVKHNTISSYESGTNMPDQNVLFAIAEVLDVNINSFFPSFQLDIEGNEHLIDEDFTQRISEKYENYQLVKIPIVGRISCGNGSLAYEDIEGYEPTPNKWLNDGEYFYLRAKGDSMKGARIEEGDLLLIRRQSIVDDGEIAVVLIGEEAVLKRVYINNEQFILQSENPNYPPIVASPGEVRIIGKLKKIVINV